MLLGLGVSAVTPQKLSIIHIRIVTVNHIASENFPPQGIELFICTLIVQAADVAAQRRVTQLPVLVATPGAGRIWGAIP